MPQFLDTMPRRKLRVLAPAKPWSVVPRRIGPGKMRRLRQMALALLALGVACRLLRYLLCFPFWGDETSLCVNFLGRDYLGLTRQLECFQVAPLLFLWGEMTAFHLLGGSEWSMRLLPLLAALGSLGLFWHLARRTLGPRPAVLALGMLAVARWPVTMSTTVKPYSLDLFFALALTTLAVHYLREPARLAWLIVLTLLVPVALLFSYPAAFVAGGVCVVLLPAAWRRGRRHCCWLLAYALLMTGTFAGAYLLVGLNQLDPKTGSVGRYMTAYWQDGFPPASPLRFFVWLVQVTAGRMMAYPIGDANGGSALTLLLFLGGAFAFVRRRKWGVIGLCLLPFLLNFVAAALHRYPYGGCCRIAQHLAPGVCLLAGAGLGRLIDRLAPGAEARFRSVAACCGLFAAFGTGQLFADVAKPYRDAEALWSRKLTRVLQNHGPFDQVVVGDRLPEVDSLLRWHLGRLGEQFSWDGRVDWESLEAHGGDLWCVSIWSGAPSTPEAARRGAEVVVNRPGWKRFDAVTYALTPWADGQPLRQCTVARWVRAGEAGEPSRAALGAWPP